jgi:hypothetical protein
MKSKILDTIKKVIRSKREKDKKLSFADQIMKNKKYQYPSKPSGDMKNSAYNDSWWM